MSPGGARRQGARCARPPAPALRPPWPACAWRSSRASAGCRRAGDRAGDGKPPRSAPRRPAACRRRERSPPAVPALPRQPSSFTSRRLTVASASMAAGGRRRLGAPLAPLLVLDLVLYPAPQAMLEVLGLALGVLRFATAATAAAVGRLCHRRHRAGRNDETGRKRHRQGSTPRLRKEAAPAEFCGVVTHASFLLCGGHEFRLPRA